MKRLLTLGLIVAVAAMAVAPMAAPARAASAGDLIKMPGNPAVYYLGSDSKRYVFPNQNTYMTWYNDFSSVVTVSQSELESYSLGGNVTYRPGTRLVKITTNPKVYAVEPGGVLRWVNSESIMSSLYGAEWWNRIDDVNDAFWVNYTEGTEITSADYPTGSLVQEEGDSTIYYIDGSEKRPIADMTAFDANRFNMDNVMTASSLSSYTDGSSITGEESAISSIDGSSSTSNGDSGSTGTLTVSLASDTPASTTVVENAMWVKFTKVNLTASGGDVTVDNVQIKRMGLGQDSNFSNVYMIDADTNEMHGSEKTLGSTHSAYVTKDVTITSGTTKAFYLAATMGGTLQAGEVASLALSEVNVKGSATVVGSLPLNGNEMTMNGTIAIGTVTISDPGLVTNGTTKPVGTTGYTLSSINLSANSTEDVQVEKIRFYQSGTAADDDIANLKLIVEGTTLATVSNPDDKYVDFDLSSSPYSISKGQNKDFELEGDIIDGSSRTIDFDIYNKADVLVKGKTYGFYRLPSGYGSSAPYYNMGKIINIDTGSLTVSKSTLSSTNIAEDSTQEEIAAFSFNAEGEPVIITQMVLEVNTTTQTNTGGLTNVTVYDENGSVVAGPVDPADDATGAYATVTLTDTFTAPKGIHTYIVKADLDSNWSANDTIRIDFRNGPDADITAKGDVTGNAITPAPTSEIQGNTVTVKVGDLDVSTSASPAAQTVAAGTSDYVFANFVLDATQSGEDVKVTQLSVHHTTTEANLHSYITGLTLYDGSTALNTPQSGESSTTHSRATSTIDLTNPLIIPKGTSKTLVLKGDISGSAANNSSHQFGLFGDDVLLAYGNSSGSSITEDTTASNGQAQTITTAGEVRMANAGANPGVGLIVADTTNTMGVFNFDALYEDIEIEKLGFTITTDKYVNIDELELYKDGSLLGSVTVTGNNATITPSSLIIPEGESENVTLKAKTHKVGEYESGTSGDNIAITLTGMDAKGKSTGSSSVTKTGLDDVASNTQYIFASVPTVTKVSLSGMANGNQDLYKFTITADSKGEVGFYKASFAVTTSSATVTNFELYEIDGSSETNLSDTALAATELYTANTNNAGGKFVVNAVVDVSTSVDSTDSGAQAWREIGAGETLTYVLRGDVTGWDSNASIQVQLMGDDANTTVAKVDTVDGVASDNFIWSDLNYGWNTSSATLTAEWTNGYQVFATTTQSF